MVVGARHHRGDFLRGSNVDWPNVVGSVRPPSNGEPLPWAMVVGALPHGPEFRLPPQGCVWLGGH